MFFGKRTEKSWVLSGAAGLLLLCSGTTAFGADETTVDQYIEAAGPYLHMSCQGAWESSGEDPEKYVAIINSFVPIAFINHDFDVQRIYDAPAADQEQLRVIFYNDIGQRCAENPQNLLAGIVERSLEYALKEIAKKGS